MKIIMCKILNYQQFVLKKIKSFLNDNDIIFMSMYNDYKSFFQKFSDFLTVIYTIFTWNKSRTLYYINNWVYTTNHKRIAVNYFWFVILSGIIGMVLATIIRLELAYPGVGIFAGDSLQYLSMVTAHGVIMVFFMIMPLLFGAFGNFLLPTQLGVHDVAFPRLNSAAFWFLPAGLIMLGQLVCIDRRYQRMNCFNIREVQSLLKRKFFVDLINTHEYKTLLNKSMINTKYKINNDSYNFSNTNLFFNSGLEWSHKIRNEKYIFFVQNKILNINLSISTYFFKKFSKFNTFNLINKSYYIFIEKTFTFFSTNKNSFFLYNLYKKTPSLHIKKKIFHLSSLIQFLYDQFIFAIKIVYTHGLWYLYNLILINFTFYSEFIIFFWNNKFIFCFKKICQNIFIFFNEFLKQFYIFLCEIYTLIIKFQFISQSPLDSLSVLNIYFSLKFEFYNSIFTWETFNNFLKKYPLDYKFIFFGIRSGNNKWITISDLQLMFLSYPKINCRDNIINEITFYFFSNYLENYIINLYLVQFYMYSFNSTFIVKPFFNLINQKMFMFINNGLHLMKLIITEFLNYFTNFVLYMQKYEKLINFYAFFEIEYIIKENWIFFKNILSKFSNKITNDFTFIYCSNFFTNFSYKKIIQFSKLEKTSQVRNQRFNSPIFKYDYKAGNYFPKLYKEMYSYLLSTLSDLTNALRPSIWFYSLTFNDDFINNMNNLSPLIFTKNKNYNLRNNIWFNTSDAFYSTMYNLNLENSFLNQRWFSINILNQKFQRMFLSSSMQQRIYSNWRQLKFSREAWRCKLLTARHQKTLYRRYVNEDGVFWSIERNAKDLLPGWAMITPFSSRTRFTAIGKVDIGLMGVFLVLNSSIISGANFLVTYRYLSTLNNRKMRDARAFFAEGVMVASWMMIAANPMLVIGIIMLLSDRHWQTSFFDYSGGGDTILFQHMFWFFGHPEVYVILIPVFGFTNTILSYYLRKRVSARASLLYSMYTIAFLGFFVWGHHMYMVGLAHTTRMLFSTLTVMISVPAATKLMHWCVTLVNSSFTMELPFLFVLTFIFFFVSGGISGMFVAHTGMDILFHDTFYVIGHFHVMLAGGAMFGSFGAFYFYFPAIFGVKYSRIYAYLHYTYYLIGQLMTVIPMFWLGYAGMPRRVLDYPASMGGWHSVISAGHLLSVAGLLAFFIMIFDSLRQNKAVLRNTFGINRYNTRLNFYLYEISRLTHIHQKTLYLYKFILPISLKLNKLNYINFEPLETTLITYNFTNKVK